MGHLFPDVEIYVFYILFFQLAVNICMFEICIMDVADKTPNI